jgi:hypothetical protein
MATAQYAKVMAELGQTAFTNTLATDSGDHTVFTVSGKTVFSNKAGYEVAVKPNGIVSGSNLLSVNATNDKVTVAGCTCYLAGVLTTVTATTATITRPSTNVAKINSITIDSTGAVAVVAGTDGSTTAFSETRNAAGGAPYIPVGSIEIGQVRVTTSAAGAIAASEIFQVVGTHAERFDYPTWRVNSVGEGDNAEVSAKKNAHIVFDAVIGDAIHTGDTYKRVYVAGYTPLFSEVPKSVDWKPAEQTHSLSSEQVYNGTVGSTSSSLSQASFSTMLEDGITDSLVALKDHIITTKFYPNRNKIPYSLTQGILGISTEFPAGSQIKATCTISAENKTANFSS